LIQVIEELIIQNESPIDLANNEIEKDLILIMETANSIIDNYNMQKKNFK
jgi:hypothetical protein